MISRFWGQVHLLDTRLFHRVLLVPRDGSLARFALLISRSANGPWFFLFLLLPWWKGGPLRHLVLGLVAGFLLELPTYKLLKAAFQRGRPCDVLPVDFLEAPPDRYSFPSGHTTAAFMVALCVAATFPMMAVVAFAWASLVGLSRIVIGVHYPLDVLAGALLGSGCAHLALSLTTL